MFSRQFSKLAVAAALALGAASAAQATVSITFTDTGTGNSVACATNSFPICTGTGAGAFTIITSFDNAGAAKVEVSVSNWNGWTFGGALGGSFVAAQYGVTEAVLNLDNFSVSRVSGGPGTLNLNGIGYDYSMPPGTAKSSFGSSSMIRQSGPALTNSSLFTNFFADDANAAGGPVAADLLDNCLATQGSGGPNSRSCSIAENWTDVGGGSFSMRISQAISLQQNQTVKTQASLTTVAGVPEPMTLSLVGVALLGAAAAARRARKA